MSNKEVTEAKLAKQVSLLQGKIEYCEESTNEIVYSHYELAKIKSK